MVRSPGRKRGRATSQQTLHPHQRPRRCAQSKRRTTSRDPIVTLWRDPGHTPAATAPVRARGPVDRAERHPVATVARHAAGSAADGRTDADTGSMPSRARRGRAATVAACRPTTTTCVSPMSSPTLSRPSRSRASAPTTSSSRPSPTSPSSPTPTARPRSSSAPSCDAPVPETPSRARSSADRSRPAALGHRPHRRDAQLRPGCAGLGHPHRPARRGPAGHGARRRPGAGPPLVGQRGHRRVVGPQPEPGQAVRSPGSPGSRMPRCPIRA